MSGRKVQRLRVSRPARPMCRRRTRRCRPSTAPLSSGTRACSRSWIRRSSITATCASPPPISCAPAPSSVPSAHRFSRARRRRADSACRECDGQRDHSFGQFFGPGLGNRPVRPHPVAEHRSAGALFRHRGDIARDAARLARRHCQCLAHLCRRRGACSPSRSRLPDSARKTEAWSTRD